MAPAVDLVVYFEDPGVHEQIMSDEPGQRHEELLAIVDIICGNWCRHISLLEDTFGSALSRVQVTLLGFSAQYRHSECNRELDVTLAHILSGHYVGLAPSTSLDDVLYPFKGFGGKEECLCEAVVLGELHIVLWNHYVEALLCAVDFNKLQDFEVVLVHIVGEGEGAHIDHIHVGVLHREDARYLTVLLLLQLLYGETLQLGEGKRIDVNLHSLGLLDVAPLVLELLLHLPPHGHGFLLQLTYSHAGRLLQLVEPVPSLDDGGLLHEVLKLRIG